MTIGGAIYAYNEQTNECMFTPNGSNISMLFYNNTASYSRNSIISMTVIHHFVASDGKVFYLNLSNGILYRGLSTNVLRLCICWQQNSSNCKNLDGIIVYPGMTLDFPMAALDKFNQVTFAEISLMLLTFNPTRTGTLHLLNKNWYLDSPMQMVSQDNWTLINITF